MSEFMWFVFGVLLSFAWPGIYYRDTKYKGVKVPKYLVGDFVSYDNKVYEIDAVEIVQKKNMYWVSCDEQQPFIVRYRFTIGGCVGEGDIAKKLSPTEYAIYNTVLSEHANNGAEKV